MPNERNRYSMQATDKGMKKLLRASMCSLMGLRCSLKEEAFRLEIFAATILWPLAFYFTSDPAERAILLVVIGLVLVTELLNTAIEKTVDRISLENHDLSRNAKDLGSAAVFLSVLLAIITWFVVLLS